MTRDLKEDNESANPIRPSDPEDFSCVEVTPGKGVLQELIAAIDIFHRRELLAA
jgi:hypothetical protein